MEPMQRRSVGKVTSPRVRDRMRGLRERDRMSVRSRAGGLYGRARQLFEPEPVPAPPQPAEPEAPIRFDPVPDLRELPAAHYVFVVGAVPRTFGGRTASILNKCRLLKEIGGVDSTIVTLNYSSEIDDIANDLRQRGLLVDGVEIVNIHDLFDGDTVYEGPDIEHPIDEPGMDKIRDPDQEVYRYYEQGVYRLYKRFDFEGRLIVRDWFNENRGRTRRDEFSSNGMIRRTTYMDLHYNKPRQEIYYRADGTPYMNKWLRVDPNSLISYVERITMMDDEGRPTHVLGSNIDLIHSYLDRLIEGDEKVFMTVESRRSDPETLGFHRPNVKQVYVLHNPHIAAPFDKPKDIRPSYQPVFDHYRKVDSLVFLTNAQRADAEAAFGEQPNFDVIPHPTQHREVGAFEDRDPDLVVMLARLDTQKQIGHAIDAFVRVRKKRPTARLEIYGHGPMEESLKAKIDALDLGGAIKLMGYTKDPSAVYQRAALSLLTSKFEGFGLVLLESLANGCPVVSYDVTYGPSDIVSDNANGFLVSAGDKAALAARILQVLNEPQLRRRLSDNAVDSGSRFSEEAFVARWSGLFHRLDDAGWGEAAQAQ